MTTDKKLYKVAEPAPQYGFRPNLFIWPNRTLLFGPLQQLKPHSMGSIAINVGLYKPFFIKTLAGVHIPFRCVIIPAGYQHEINACGNIVASLLIEKNSIDFMHLKQLFSAKGALPTKIFDRGLIDCFQTIYEEKPSKQEIGQMLDRLLFIDEKTSQDVDPRIDRAMKIIQSEPDNPISQEQIAASVGLSASRFRHLFREHSDIPYRRYRMWRRTLAAMSSLHKVDNLTYAAMQAGFTDSAHFSHCFQDIFGVRPSLVFKNLDRFEV